MPLCYHLLHYRPSRPENSPETRLPWHAGLTERRKVLEFGTIADSVSFIPALISELPTI